MLARSVSRQRPRTQTTTGSAVYITGAAGGDTVQAGSGTTPWSAGSRINYLRGNDGDDPRSPRALFLDDAVIRNQGNDTIHGNGGDDHRRARGGR
jgi:Ca2+-binding RTX toxin-like protein